MRLLKGNAPLTGQEWFVAVYIWDAAIPARNHNEERKGTAEFLCFGGSVFVVCTAAGDTRQGAGLSCLKAQEKNKNFINSQVFAFQMLDTVSEPNSG